MTESVSLGVFNTQGPARAQLFLILHEGKPLKLGEGKFAKVFLGATTVIDDLHPANIGDLIAIKFLKKDQSATVTSNSVYRFCQEVRRTALCQSAGLGSVVSFVGYGRIGTLPPAGSRDMQLMEEGFDLDLSQRTTPGSAHPLFGSATRQELDEYFANNIGKEIDDDFAAMFTGDFYGLQLCLMSLEELLLTRGDPFSQSSGQALTACGIVNAPVLTSRRQDARMLQALGISLRPNANGFQDIETMGSWLEEKMRIRGKPSSSIGARFSASMLFNLALKCLSAVQQIHEAPEQHNDDKGFAHRDIKPANMLLAIEPADTILLSDLGFVASVGEIRAGNHTVLASIDEGGVLPCGSKGFRAPEQIESGEEFSFSPDATGKILSIFSYFDTQIDAGDFLKVSGEFKDKSKLTRIISVKTSELGDSTACHIAVGLANDEKLQKGRLIKDVSIHSDIFSIGCVAYYLGSEGRNPERFMRYFVEHVAQHSLETVLPRWVLQSPLWMASILCLGDEKTTLADIERAKDGIIMETGEALPVRFNEEFDQMRLGLMGGASLYLPGKADANRIHAYRDGLKKNSTLGDLLIGKISRRPISFPQLYLTFLCCLRDSNGSVVRRDSRVVDADGVCEAVYSKKADTFARRIDQRVANLKNGESVSGDWLELAALGEHAGIFVRARLSIRDLSPQDEADAGGRPAVAAA